MEGFTYQHSHPSFFLDPVYFQQSTNGMPFLPQQVGEMSTTSSCFTSYNSSDVELFPTPQASSEDHKRKQTDHGSCLSTGKSKGAKGSKSRQHKKAMDIDESKRAGEKQAKAKEVEATNEEPPLGYIHVRARRGQATDSHSIAERVRRERISVRMKKLQGLVPGCDKVIGKALVLDEIINYVQSLQNQVEFLSMKLASSNPVVYDFGADYDELMNQPEEMGSMSQPMPSVIQHTPSTYNFHAVESSVPFSLQGQGPTNFSEDGGSFLMQVGDHTTRDFANQVEFQNMCSFH